MPQRDIAHLGQVFTPAGVVERMVALSKNRGRVLEPSCGDGAFLPQLSARFSAVVALELDARHCPSTALNQDFFTYPVSEKFATIIGNPPYVKARAIASPARQYWASSLLNGHANLYLYFIEKCVHHLQPGGELIFITPRDFLKATGAMRLNQWLSAQGSFSHFLDLGDTRIFKDALPNCAIWRYVLGDLRHRLEDGRSMKISAGQVLLTHGDPALPLNQICAVKVGAVSGCDAIFSDTARGNRDFVCSQTAQSGVLRRMYLPPPDVPPPRWLLPHKRRLLQRRVRAFDERNWWHWGRLHHLSAAARVYVNGRTRNPQPFFTHPCQNYDGAVLALFPHRADVAVHDLAAALNAVDWRELGFVCDGRFLFSQRALENALLPPEFARFAPE